MKKNKTVRMCLAGLPDVVIEKVLDNVIKQGTSHQLHAPCSSTSKSILISFSWGKSKEGIEYWNAIFNQLIEQENEKS
jgi:hypothetical protein